MVLRQQPTKTLMKHEIDNRFGLLRSWICAVTTLQNFGKVVAVTAGPDVGGRKFGDRYTVKMTVLNWEVQQLEGRQMLMLDKQRRIYERN